MLELVEVDDSGVFSAVVSNPPYQHSRADGNGSMGVYHFFMDVAQSLGEYVSMVYPFKWTITGRGDGFVDFREREIQSRNYMKFIADSRDKSVFEDIVILGGINMFLWKKKERKPSEPMDYMYNGVPHQRDSLLNGTDVFIPDPRMVQITEKIDAKKLLKVSTIYPYGRKYTSVTRGNLDALPKGSGLFIYVSTGERIAVPPMVTQHKTDDYKVFVSLTAHGTDEKLARLDRAFIGSPGELCSQSFLRIGSFETRQGAINAVRYLKTDFVSFLIGIITPTQHAYRRVYKLVPDVNFVTGEISDKPGVFLDFGSPETLDDQLSEIYGITDEERHLMTKDLKPWKDKIDPDADR